MDRALYNVPESRYLRSTIARALAGHDVLSTARFRVDKSSIGVSISVDGDEVYFTKHFADGSIQAGTLADEVITIPVVANAVKRHFDLADHFNAAIVIDGVYEGVLLYADAGERRSVSDHEAFEIAKDRHIRIIGTAEKADAPSRESA